MKVVLSALSALLVVLALSQAAEAKKKNPVTEDKAAKVEQTRPPLDNTSTGGITTADAKAAPANQDGYNPIYPPALYLNF
jgi:hypothetical protein